MEIVEAAGPPRYEDLIDLINASWPEQFGRKSDAEKVSELAESYDASMDTVKYLTDDGRIIGMYRYTLWPHFSTDTKTSHTLEIVLLPEYQRQGLGTLLLRDMVQDCRKKGMKLLLSRSFKDNPGSIRLHRSFGFTVHAETNDSIIWQYTLEP
jgi:L-amino acid N-acyltransferase YncA